MAAFTDQFARRDPLAFNPGDIFRDRLATAVESARELLVGRDREAISALAAVTASVVESAAMALAREEDRRTGGDWYDESSEADMAAKARNESRYSKLFREDLGELGVYLTASFGTFHSVSSRAGLKIERWESLAVMSLWLAMDCADELDGVRRAASEPRRGYQAVTPEELFPDGVPANLPGIEHEAAIVLALDAMRASALAVELRARSLDRATMQRGDVDTEMRRRLQEMEERDRAAQAALSKRNSEASRARWAAKNNDHIVQALAIARAKPFKSFAAAAREIERQVMKTEGGTEGYTQKTIIAWLNDAHWKPTKPTSRAAKKG